MRFCHLTPPSVLLFYSVDQGNLLVKCKHRMRFCVMVGRRTSHQHLFLIEQQFQLDQHCPAIEYVLYFSSLFGFSCRLTEHRIPPQRQAVQRWASFKVTDQMHRHNSSLEYEFIVPDRSLTDFVYCFSMLKNMQSINDIILIPNARIDLFFVKELDNQFRIVLVGFETKPSLLPKNDHACIYIVSFNPLAVEYIFKHTVSCILDSQKTLPDNFWGFNVDDLDDFEAFCTKISKKIQSLLSTEIDERKRKLFELIYASNGEVLVKTTFFTSVLEHKANQSVF